MLKIFYLPPYTSQQIYTQYDNKREILLAALCRLQHITAPLVNPETAAQRLYVAEPLYINIYNMAALFILSAFIMPSEGHFGIRYDMDFPALPILSRPIYWRSSVLPGLYVCVQ